MSKHVCVVDGVEKRNAISYLITEAEEKGFANWVVTSHWRIGDEWFKKTKYFSELEDAKKYFDVEDDRLCVCKGYLVTLEAVTES